MIYVIDHKDSFTHNVVHQLSLFDEVECDNYNKVDKTKLNKAKVIVFSPGPGNPKNYPLTSKIYNQFKGKKKIIGICLGFQQMSPSSYSGNSRTNNNYIKFIFHILF